MDAERRRDTWSRRPLRQIVTCHYYAFVFRDFLYLCRLLGPAYGNPLLLPGISREWVQCPMAAFLHDSALVKHINGITEPAVGHGLIDTAALYMDISLSYVSVYYIFCPEYKKCTKCKNSCTKPLQGQHDLRGKHPRFPPLYICSSMIWQAMRPGTDSGILPPISPNGTLFSDQQKQGCCPGWSP